MLPWPWMLGVRGSGIAPPLLHQGTRQSSQFSTSTFRPGKAGSPSSENLELIFENNFSDKVVIADWFSSSSPNRGLYFQIFQMDTSTLSLICEIGYKTTDVFWNGNRLSIQKLQISFGNGFELTCDKKIGQIFKFVWDEKIGQNRIILRIWWYF